MRIQSEKFSTSDGGRLVIATWPGRDFTDNTFLLNFIEALEALECKVITVEDPIRDLKRCQARIFLIHWPEKIYWSPGSFESRTMCALRFLVQLAFLRARGTKIVWMVHNLAPHDMARKMRVFWPLYSFALSLVVDAFMTLSPATIDAVKATYRGIRHKPHEWIRLGAYKVPEANTREATRATLGVGPGEKIISLLGLLRPYKGVEDLLAAFETIKRDDVRLLFGGEVSTEGLLGILQAAAAKDPRIIVRSGRLNEQMFFDLHAATDIVALPMTKYLHSSSIAYALSARCRVVTPRMPFAEDLRALVGTEWIDVYDGKITANVLESALSSSNATGEPDMSSLGWAAAAARTKAFLASV